MKLTDVNLEVTSHDKATFSVDAWKARYEVIGMLDYYEKHRNESPRSILFNPEIQPGDKVFVLEPPVFTGDKVESE